MGQVTPCGPDMQDVTPPGQGPLINGVSTQTPEPDQTPPAINSHESEVAPTSRDSTDSGANTMPAGRGAGQKGNVAGAGFAIIVAVIARANGRSFWLWLLFGVMIAAAFSVATSELSRTPSKVSLLFPTIRSLTFVGSESTSA